MALGEELQTDVAEILRRGWTDRDGQVVPEPEDLKLGNDGVKLNATVLYADMSDSTKLVDTYTRKFAAEVYKAYLTCAARIIRQQAGSITAYDGDRIMAVFIGDNKDSYAAVAGLMINHAVLKIVNPAIRNQYPDTAYTVSHVVGVDSSDLLAARTGIRKYNDIVWVGPAANYAAKLATIPDRNKVYVTPAVFEKMSDNAKSGGNPRRAMWSPRQWSQMNNRSIYSSDWTWSV